MIHEIVICANIFIRKDGKYLLLKRADDKSFAPWFVHPFGWRVEQDENPFEAAEREIQEEVWITVKNIKLEAVITELQPNKDKKENRMIFHFSADYDSGEIKEIDLKDGSAIYLEKDKIWSQKLFPSVKAIIDDLLDEGKETVFTTMSYAGEESWAKVERKDIA